MLTGGAHVTYSEVSDIRVSLLGDFEFVTIYGGRDDRRSGEVEEATGRLVGGKRPVAQTPRIGLVV